ncbi:MAG TPA: hypothetical protein VFG68_08500 [Fimbriiglobus sp.]|nr:hypothetical protein [Fimbriiglobus sp.]
MSRKLKAAAAACAVASGLGSVGCFSTDAPRTPLDNRWASLVDPCYPERYNYVARAEVLSPFAIHAANGAIIDTTLWTYHFDAGTDKLNPAGLERLDYLVRKRPAPPARLYLQTARDLAYDSANPDKMVAARDDLNLRRAESIKRYVTAATAGRGMTFDVAVIDPADMSFRAEGPANAARGWPGRFQSGIGGVSNNNLSTTGGGATPGTTGGTGTAGGTGTTSR